MTALYRRVNLSRARPRRGRAGWAFLSSCLYLVAMLAGAAAGLYPTLLPSSTDSGARPDVAEALSGPHAVRVGLVWWCFGILLAIVYFVTIYRMFCGKVSGETGYSHLTTRGCPISGALFAPDVGNRRISPLRFAPVEMTNHV